ncbi:hypothetical protein Fcan01_24212 [Folsomia candida]|uniref:Uncharacterized protein n=1 Tax=Folsomia candida TaxID=158441 RepID=A0A226D7B1_FOLCA|nr:hypothetical protein Fcan01_24212 [Folsomia candida]
MVWLNWANETDYIRKHSPKNVALLSRNLDVFSSLLQLQQQVLKGVYKCFATKNVALNEGRFAVLTNILRFEIAQSIKMLDQGGFQSVWDREIRHFLKLKAMKWPEMKAPSDYISMNTLWPFFKIVGIALMFVFIIGILEVVWPGGKMWTLFKLRLRDTLTVGNFDQLDHSLEGDVPRERFSRDHYSRIYDDSDETMPSRGGMYFRKNCAYGCCGHDRFGKCNKCCYTRPW